jgi:hypothetical protein
MSTPVGGPAGPDGPGALSRVERAAVRQCLLAVSVVHDIDLLPTDDGVVLLGRKDGGVAVVGVPDIEVSLDDIASAIGDADASTTTAHLRAYRWLAARRAIAERSLDELAETARPVALPVGHELHPGRSWVKQRVLGGFLDLGLGFAGLRRDLPEAVVVVPTTVLAAAGIDASPWWSAATEYLENMGALATARWRREPRSPLRPMGDCDVITLLASAVFRGALCADAGGMRAIAAPVRTRGWLDLSRIDPAFAQTAAAIADDESRGFPRPLLLTVDEVTMVSDGGRPAEIVLRDPAVERAHWLRDVLYH